jgi:hypothetical protein
VNRSAVLRPRCSFWTFSNEGKSRSLRRCKKTLAAITLLLAINPSLPRLLNTATLIPVFHPYSLAPTDTPLQVLPPHQVFTIDRAVLDHNSLPHNPELCNHGLLWTTTTDLFRVRDATVTKMRRQRLLDKIQQAIDQQMRMFDVSFSLAVSPVCRCLGPYLYAFVPCE